MDLTKFQTLVYYLKHSDYLVEMTKNQKRILRDSAKSFFLRGDVLYHLRDNMYLNDLEKRKKHAQEVIVGDAEKSRIIREAHDGALGGHWGEKKTIEQVAKEFFWPGFSKDIKDYIKKCDRCLKQNAVHKPPPSVLHPIPVNNQFGYRWVVDLVKLNRTPQGNEYVAVATEYLTRFPVVKAIPRKTAEEVGRFIFEDVICMFGVMKILQHDQGTEFHNYFVKFMADKLNVKDIRSTAYHPQTNGLVERFNQTLETALMKGSDEEIKNWDLRIQPICYHYRSTIQDSTKKTPYEMVFGCRPRLPMTDGHDKAVDSELNLDEAIAGRMAAVSGALISIREEGLENLKKAQVKMKKRYDLKHAAPNYQVGDKVLVKNSKRDNTKSGGSRYLPSAPHRYYVINAKIDDKVYRIMNMDGIVLMKAVSVDRLKAYTVPEGQPQMEQRTRNVLLANVSNSAPSRQILPNGSRQSLPNGSARSRMNETGYASNLMKINRGSYRANSTSVNGSDVLPLSVSTVSSSNAAPTPQVIMSQRNGGSRFTAGDTVCFSQPKVAHQTMANMNRLIDTNGSNLGAVSNLHGIRERDASHSKPPRLPPPVRFSQSVSNQLASSGQQKNAGSHQLPLSANPSTSLPNSTRTLNRVNGSDVLTSSDHSHVIVDAVVVDNFAKKFRIREKIIDAVRVKFPFISQADILNGINKFRDTTPNKSFKDISWSDLINGISLNVRGDNELQFQQPTMANTSAGSATTVSAQRWFYNKNGIKGPFTSSDMQTWFAAGYFKNDSRIRREEDISFMNLGDQIKKLGINLFGEVDEINDEELRMLLLATQSEETCDNQINKAVENTSPSHFGETILFSIQIADELVHFFMRSGETFEKVYKKLSLHLQLPVNQFMLTKTEKDERSMEDEILMEDEAECDLVTYFDIGWRRKTSSEMSYTDDEEIEEILLSPASLEKQAKLNELKERNIELLDMLKSKEILDYVLRVLKCEIRSDQFKKRCDQFLAWWKEETRKDADDFNLGFGPLKNYVDKVVKLFVLYENVAKYGKGNNLVGERFGYDADMIPDLKHITKSTRHLIRTVVFVEAVKHSLRLLYDVTEEIADAIACGRSVNVESVLCNPTELFVNLRRRRNEDDQMPSSGLQRKIILGNLGTIGETEKRKQDGSCNGRQQQEINTVLEGIDSDTILFTEGIMPKKNIKKLILKPKVADGSSNRSLSNVANAATSRNTRARENRSLKTALGSNEATGIDRSTVQALNFDNTIDNEGRSGLLSATPSVLRERKNKKTKKQVETLGQMNMAALNSASAIQAGSKNQETINPQRRSGRKKKQASQPASKQVCLCNGAGDDDGEWVGCDNECDNDWYHCLCVGLKVAPKGKWYCRNCRGSRSNVLKRK